MGVASGAGAANSPAIAGTVSPNNAVNPGVAKKTDEPARHWAFDTSNGCKVWSADPIGGDITVRWSGRCENGLAQGLGTVRWLGSNKQVAELSGTMEQGKLRGRVTGVEEPGNRFEGMYIDSLPEGPGKASFADGSTYDGQWHRGHQLGYGVMTFPPAHPQYQEMLKDGKGSKTDNGVYVLRGWWEGKIFITPCNSEEECEKAVVVLMKLDQDAAAKSNAAAQTAPVPIAAPVVDTSVAMPQTPMMEPAAPATLPAIVPEAVPVIVAPATPAIPAMEPAVVPPLPIPAEPALEPASTMPAAVSPDAEPAAAPANATPAPELPATGPAITPVAPMPAMPATEEPTIAPTTEPMPVAPVTAPASEPAAPAIPEAEPAPAPKAVTPAPQASDAVLGASQPISISDGSS
ncbi:MAG: hypothetical protein ABI171_14430 [Collimonas sp.]|uniref:hypothetical protein n=1 Tax=Collimonas sp. TaxID=1963772 RepID=UPI003267A883